MHGLLIAILLISSVCLIVLVLMQSGKGSGLSGAFGSAGGDSSLFGANTANVVMKATAVFSAIFMLSCIGVALVQESRYKPMKGIEDEVIEKGKAVVPPADSSEKKEDVKEPTSSTGIGGETGKAPETTTESKEPGIVEGEKEKTPAEGTGTTEEKKEPGTTEEKKEPESTETGKQ
jgi:preprotein translocase subunit SecG